MNATSDSIVDLGFDVNGGISSINTDNLTKKELKKLNGRRPVENGGKWIYVDGIETTGHRDGAARYLASRFATALIKYGIRVGKIWVDDVTSWYIWESNEEDASK